MQKVCWNLPCHFKTCIRDPLGHEQNTILVIANRITYTFWNKGFCMATGIPQRDRANFSKLFAFFHFLILLYCKKTLYKFEMYIENKIILPTLYYYILYSWHQTISNQSLQSFNGKSRGLWDNQSPDIQKTVRILTKLGCVRE